MDKRFLVGIIALFHTQLFAADLLEVYQEAKQNDSTFASAQSSWEAGQEKLPQGRALLLPNVGLSANTTYNDNNIKFRDANSTTMDRKYNTNGYTITATQPIYRKQNFAQYQQSKYQVEQANAQYSLAQQDLILRVTQVYFDVLLAQDTIAFAESQKAAIGEQLAQAKRNFEVGTATITDTHEAQARYDLVVAQEITAQNDLDIKRYALLQIIGKMPELLKTLPINLSLSAPEPNDMNYWVEQAQRESQQVKIQQAAYDIATEEVSRNRGGHYPTVDLVGTYGDNSAGNNLTSGIGNDTKSKTLGLQLNVPLFSGGAVSSRVREAIALQEKALHDLETARRNATLQARQAFLGVSAGMAQTKALEQALVSSESSLNSSKLGQEVGVRTAVDVLNAQQQLFSAKRDLAQSRYNYLLSRLRLKAAAGSLTEEDLKTINQLLNGA
jgi:outer membrane protein